mmetsp:Transcript_10084/g.27586  ORF Transcript_10084/g.27586 Transcript_10084/m.27586 type:complete len:754 (-) Transcript_10084:1000-3261(-)|eukprot:CAMPEP_0202374430 /NCGR_PEP_ID=MMETSP1127-20130417/5261_1 /ASSEMBLY_ACC=CAM_ASM_000462 /TAXON_ID=3047 /ORGANISM="Dunaliella tertiolecta, Strain CCMP1320" /LENGTH=753 /DNA_ID=CAMNT_0048971579 /DNA_START=1957 /DNA_END=4218 /DNA_ORIENTATION=+
MLLQSLKELTSTSKSPIGKSRSGRHRLATSSHDSYNWDNEGSHRTSNGPDAYEGSSVPSSGADVQGALVANPVFASETSRGGGPALRITDLSICGMTVDEKLKLWASQDLWLSIKLVKAKNLGIFNQETLSSDPWARMRLLSSHKSPLSRERAVLPAAEYRTRTIHRNLSPMVQEALIIPLGKETNGKTVFNLLLYDADLLADGFMGQLNVPLEQLLYSCTGEPLLQWYALRAPVKRAGARDNGQEGRGELLLQVELMSANEATLARHAQEDFRIPEFLHSRYCHSHLQLGMRQLAISCTGRSKLDAVLDDLSIKVRIGMTTVLKPVEPQSIKKSRDGLEFDLEFNDKIQVPLSEAFVGSFRSWNNKAAAECADIFVYLMSGARQLNKTQVPIWVVPFCPEGMECDQQPLHLTRDMQLYSARPLMASCEITLDLSIMPSSKVAEALPAAEEEEEEGGGGVGSDGFEDEEDVPDAGPFTLAPPPLETKVLERQFGCGPCKLYQLLVKSDSSLAASVAASEGLTKVEIGEWKVAGKGRQRTVTYTKPLSIPVPFAPKQADVTEVHTLQVKEVSGWVLDIVITTDAPKGDLFRVVTQVVGQQGPGPRSSTLRVTLTLDFVKNPGLLRGAITSGASKDTALHWETLSRKLESHLQSAGGEAPEEVQDGTSAAAPNVPVPASPSAPLTVSGTWPVFLLLALLLLLLVLLLVSMLRGSRSLLLQTEQLSVSMQHLQQAQQRLRRSASSEDACVSGMQAP